MLYNIGKKIGKYRKYVKAFVQIGERPLDHRIFVIDCIYIASDWMSIFNRGDLMVNIGWHIVHTLSLTRRSLTILHNTYELWTTKNMDIIFCSVQKILWMMTSVPKYRPIVTLLIQCIVNCNIKRQFKNSIQQAIAWVPLSSFAETRKVSALRSACN